MMTRKDKGADREANLEWSLSAQIMWKINWNWSWFLVSVFISYVPNILPLNLKCSKVFSLNNLK
jgi:hypothetical protein